MGVRVVFRWSALFRVASVLDAVAVVVQKCVPWDTKHSQIGSIPSITTTHRSDRRAADPSTIVARLSLFRLPWLQYPPASGFCLQLGASFGCFVVLQSAASLQSLGLLILPPAIPFRQFSGHSITIGSTVTEGRQSARPALPLLLWGVLPMALFGSSQCLGGVIRSRSPDSVLRPTASCKALSRHLTQGQRLAPLVN